MLIKLKTQSGAEGALLHTLVSQGSHHWSQNKVKSRDVCLLKQQASVTFYRLPTMENKFPFFVSFISVDIYIETTVYI